ncbi:MAG: LacI family DNA-binding transcriptional regulator [Lentisphaerota bacterium]
MGAQTKQVTTADIARYTGLSKMTVSRVLNNHPYVSVRTRERVLEAVSKLGFRPNTLARRFFTGKTRLIGLIIPLKYMLSSYYFKEVFEGVRECLEQHDYDILLHDSTTQSVAPHDKCLDLVKGRLAEGLLISAPMDYDVYPSLLAKEDVPLVVIGETASGPGVNRVGIPNRQGAEQAVRQLIHAGHRRIAMLTFGQNHLEGRERWMGYLDALKQTGIPADPALVVEARYNRLAAQEETRRLLAAHPDLTAIMAANSDMALGAVDAIRSLGLRIPGDISLVAFDDCAEMELNDPPITAIRQFPGKVGNAAAHLLLDILEGRSSIHDATCRLIDVEYISRQSIAPPSAQRNKHD